jgi:hypothetical protein
MIEKNKLSKSKQRVLDNGWSSENIRKATEAAREAEEKKGTVAIDPVMTQSSMTEFLKENLKMELVRSNFTDPNNREVRLMLGEELLSTINIDVVQKSEYEG